MQQRKRVAVLISGRGSNMEALADAAASGDFPAEIVAVLSDKPEADGLQIAKARGIMPITVPRRDFPDKTAHEAAVLVELSRIKPDIICLAGYMRILSAAFIAHHRGRIVNIHPSLLPLFPGLDTHARALDAGIRIHGCSVHFVTEGMDEGPIIAQAAVPVMPGDTPDTLSARVLAAEHRLYPAALALLARGDVLMSADQRCMFAEGFAEMAMDSAAMLIAPA